MFGPRWWIGGKTSVWLSEGGVVCSGGYYGDVCLCLVGIHGATSAFLLLLLLLLFLLLMNGLLFLVWGVLLGAI